MVADANGRTPIERALRIAVLGVALGFFVAQVAFAVTNWSLADMDAYWEAALRLRDGEALYPHVPDTTTAEVYRYAPWFALAWVPISFVPRELVAVAWSAALVAATAAAIWRIGRTGTPPALAAAALIGGLLVLIDSTGNVHALLIAALLFGATRRTGPLWIALGASLKVVPILYALVYIGRRQWLRAGTTVVLTLALVLPMLAFDLTFYPVDPGELSFSLFNRVPLAWAALAGTAATVTLVLSSRASRHAWLAASVAAVLALPRLWTYDFTFLAVGLAEDSEDEA